MAGDISGCVFRVRTGVLDLAAASFRSNIRLGISVACVIRWKKQNRLSILKWQRRETAIGAGKDINRKAGCSAVRCFFEGASLRGTTACQAISLLDVRKPSRAA